MSTAAGPKSSSRSGSRRQSPFFRDLATPISSHRPGTAAGRFTSAGQAAAVSSLWRENFSAGADPPPPPVFTLEDRVDFSPEPGLAESPATPRTPTPPRPSSPLKGRVEPSGSPRTSSWWSPLKSSGGERVEGSPVDGVVQPSTTGSLLALPPPQEVARPELEISGALPARGLDEEEWVTVFGFYPADTNLVLQEFERCGLVLKHIPGPSESNWMHILYQSGYDAQKALKKDGIQISSILIIGVKPVDPAQRQFLNERVKDSIDFRASMPSQTASGKSSTVRSPFAATPRPYYLQNGSTSTSDSSRRSTGAIATPAKSVVSKVVDLMFGI